MEGITRGMQSEECLLYLDNIIYFEKSFDQELGRLIGTGGDRHWVFCNTNIEQAAYVSL